MYEELTAKDLDKKVSGQKQAAVVYYTTLAADVDIKEEWKHVKKLGRQLKGLANLFVVRVAEGDDLPAGQLIFYPNMMTGEEKMNTAVKLPFDRDDSSMTGIIDKIGDAYNAAYMPIQGMMFNDAVVQLGRNEQKNVIYTLYRDKLPLNFKALTTHPIFFDGVEHSSDITFVAVDNVDMQNFGGLTEDMLPALGVIEKIDPTFSEGELRQQTMPNSLPFDTLLSNVALLTGKKDELEMYQQGKKLTKVKRNFGEIVTAADLKTRCLDYEKGCAIGLLPAMTISEYEATNHAEHISTLENLDE